MTSDCRVLLEVELELLGQEVELEHPGQEVEGELLGQEVGAEVVGEVEEHILHFPVVGKRFYMVGEDSKEELEYQLMYL